jgi:hypothetical protein
MNIKQFVTIILVAAYMVSCGLFDTQSEQNKKFSCDIVRVLRTIYESRTKDKPEPDFYKLAYGIKQSIEDAHLIMKPWANDSDPNRRRVLEYINTGLSDLQSMIDLTLESTFPVSQKKGAEITTKLDAGLKKLYSASLVAMDRLRLSKSDKEEIAYFTKQIFNTELSELAKKINTGSKDEVAWEIWGAAVMAGEFPK